MKTFNYLVYLTLLSTAFLSLNAQEVCDNDDEELRARLAEQYRENQQPYQFPHSSFRDDEQMEMDEDASWAGREEDSFLESLRR